MSTHKSNTVRDVDPSDDAQEYGQEYRPGDLDGPGPVTEGRKPKHMYGQLLAQKEKVRNKEYQDHGAVWRKAFTHDVFQLHHLATQGVRRMLFHGVPIPMRDEAVITAAEADTLCQCLKSLPHPAKRSPDNPWNRTGLTAGKLDPEAARRVGPVKAWQACFLDQKGQYAKWVPEPCQAIIEKIFTMFEGCQLSRKGVTEGEAGSCPHIFVMSEKCVDNAGVFHGDVMYEAENSMEELYNSRFGFTVWFCLEDGQPPISFFWDAPQGPRSDFFQKKFSGGHHVKLKRGRRPRAGLTLKRYFKKGDFVIFSSIWTVHAVSPSLLSRMAICVHRDDREDNEEEGEDGDD